ncbi:MAG: hypothetical protein JJU28_18885 [Cyclobacteriaceae bacterium]|nr:hypothetical protein [Cyclobacteriaceae bacterium]
MKNTPHLLAMAAIVLVFSTLQSMAENNSDLTLNEPTKSDLDMVHPADFDGEIIAEDDKVLVTSDKAEEIAYTNALLNRIYEIKEMDKSVMSSQERKELKKEVRDIQKELREVQKVQRNSGGIFISVGAAILIVLLLILLL